MKQAVHPLYHINKAFWGFASKKALGQESPNRSLHSQKMVKGFWILRELLVGTSLVRKLVYLLTNVLSKNNHPNVGQIYHAYILWDILPQTALNFINMFLGCWISPTKSPPFWWFFPPKIHGSFRFRGSVYDTNPNNASWKIPANNTRPYLVFLN